LGKVHLMNIALSSNSNFLNINASNSHRFKVIFSVMNKALHNKNILWGLILLFSLQQFVFSQHLVSDEIRLNKCLHGETITNYDVNYIEMDLDIDIYNKRIKGFCLISFDLLDKSKDSVEFNLDKRLDIDSITGFNTKKLKYFRSSDKIWISLNEIKFQDEKLAVKIFYNGSPREAEIPPWYGGLVWSTDNNGDQFSGVCCQLQGSKLWWPSNSRWNDKIDSTLIKFKVPKDYQVISNGRLVSKRQDSTGRIAYTWKTSYPMVSYNLTFYIGKYTHYQEIYHNIADSFLLHYYILPEYIAEARLHFDQVKRILSAYENYFGDYPFVSDEFKIVQSPYIGMEHQSAIAYGGSFKNGIAGLDYSGINLPYDYLLIHEIAHEWWGNSVTASSINDIWIHESLATYSEALLVEKYYGFDSSQLYINRDIQHLLMNKYPLCDTILGSVYNSDMYIKGAAIWNTLRYIVDDDEKWFELIKQIQFDFRYSSISTIELIEFINYYLNVDYSSFFNQFIYSSAIPVMEITDIEESVYNYGIRWRNCNDDFKTPIHIRDDNLSKTIIVSSNPSVVKINDLGNFISDLQSKTIFKVIHIK